MSIIDDFDNMAECSILPQNKIVELEEKIFRNITSRINTILYGPPGTGKTHTVLTEINALKDKGIVEEILVIQFHPQYTYQDFIEGYKFDGNSFKYKKGVFLDFCEKVKNDKLNIIYIDEINRADLASVFGELLYLMDRDINKKVLLPLSGDCLYFPENVIIIGSMNSSDKSISLIDFALRRRFDFVPPNIKGFNNIISKKDIQDDIDFIKYSRFFQVINSRILKHPLLGKNMTLGHSMFFSKSHIISNESLFDALTSIVIPQIESYFGSENFAEISQILNPEIAKKLMYGMSITTEEINLLIDVVASSDEEILF